MMSRFVNAKRNQMGLRPGRLAIAGLAALTAVEDHADARSGRSERAVESIDSRTAGEAARLSRAILGATFPRPRQWRGPPSRFAGEQPPAIILQPRGWRGRARGRCS
ncbi:MAG: hypothetical protein ACJ8D7_18695, partial [Xanthobacteraceae bacterium]